MTWKNQLKKHLWAIQKKKSQTQLSENPEEAKKKKEQNLIFDALGMVTDAINRDTSMSDDRHMKQMQLLYEKMINSIMRTWVLLELKEQRGF